MDLSYSEEYEAFRAEVRGFLEANWPPREEEVDRDEQVARFRARAIDAGYLARAIPRAYGGSEQPADAFKASIVRDEFRRVRAPRDPVGIGPSMLVPTLLSHGAEWQKERFVPPTLRGELIWCQGYSEPGSGSDLASVQTRAELEGDEWVIHGQKIWTSGARDADLMFCLCRTEPDAPKHAGISYLLLDMKQRGIEVTPLRQMTGDSAFNQVFFDGARTPADWIVGRRGEGWSVSRTTLVHERNSIASAQQITARFDALVDLARRVQRDGRPAIEDPSIRQRLARLEGSVQSQLYSGYRQLTRSARGRDPGIVQLMNKLVGTQIATELAELAFDLLGDDALHEPDEPRPGERLDDASRWVLHYMGSLGAAIAGGTSNIQRNVIAERGLGLPRDRAAQRD
jgi:alkylation response protein AidB-like acyl-CoA dehydrogenase